MFNSHNVFKKNINDAIALGVLFKYLKTLAPPADFDDVLRSQIMYAVSAFDKLMHDLVTVGMVQTYQGNRTPPTSKYLNEPLTLAQIDILDKATIPPKGILFEGFIIKKLSHLSFQDPEKLSAALSFIWANDNKWAVISTEMAKIGHLDPKTRLKLIADRRNSIVHQADIDPISKSKYTISDVEAMDINNFLSDLGTCIYDLVK